MLLDKFKEINDIEQIEKTLREYYSTFDYNEYLPAIVSQGRFLMDKESSDLYIKLVLVHNTVPIKNSWLKRNMSGSFYDIDDGEDNYAHSIHNVITQRNYTSNLLYQLNPVLVDDNYIIEYPTDNTNIVNQRYNTDKAKYKGKEVLKYEKEEKVMLLKQSLSNYINPIVGNVYPKFQLIAEFEYRNSHNHIKYRENDNEYPNGFIHFNSSDRYGTYCRGSFKIELTYKEKRLPYYDIKVLDLSGKSRKLNPKNYDDDTEVGLVIFAKECLEVITRDYVILDLNMYDKKDYNADFIIDVLEDKVVFWEGVFNNLPIELKTDLVKYNFIPVDKKGIISPAMFKWQLEAQFLTNEDRVPTQQLGLWIAENKFNLAVDINLSLYPPSNSKEFMDMFLKLEEYIGLSVYGFNTKVKDVKDLIEILEQKEVQNFGSEHTMLFQKYCNQLYIVLSKNE